MDNLSADRRRWLMGRVKSKNTTPEIQVRRIVYGMGYRYRLHDSRLPGTPDLVFLGRRAVIFVHGCFWHGHLDCKFSRLPKTRIDFWKNKIDQNRRRDARNELELINNGWQVLNVWQCELRDSAKLSEKLRNFLEHLN